eukprot:scaffold63426_cov39-Attheya_sp.AAC.1
MGNCPSNPSNPNGKRRSVPADIDFNATQPEERMKSNGVSTCTAAKSTIHNANANQRQRST